MIPLPRPKHYEDLIANDQFEDIYLAVEADGKFTIDTIQRINEPPVQEQFNRFAQVYLDDAWWGDLRTWNEHAIAAGLV